MIYPSTKTYPKGYYKIDYHITPETAQEIIDSVPCHSYHWVDIPRKRAGKVEEYAELLASGKWEPQLKINGMDQHPIRFNQYGELTHGLVRLLAITQSDTPMDAVIVFPPNSRWQRLFIQEDEYEDA